MPTLMPGLVWKSEVKLWELDLSSHHVGPKVPSQVVRFGGKCLYWLSYLTALIYFLIKKKF